MVVHRIVSVLVFESCFMVTLQDKSTLRVPWHAYYLLRYASPDQRENYEIHTGGRGIHWPDVDEDLSVDGLVKDWKAHSPFPPRTFQQHLKTVRGLGALYGYNGESIRIVLDKFDELTKELEKVANIVHNAPTASGGPDFVPPKWARDLVQDIDNLISTVFEKEEETNGQVPTNQD